MLIAMMIDTNTGCKAAITKLISSATVGAYFPTKNNQRDERIRTSSGTYGSLKDSGMVTSQLLPSIY